MRTDDLIAQLSRQPVRAPFAQSRVYAAVGVAILLCTAVFLGFAGPRPDLASALLAPVTAAKTLLPAVVFVVSLRAAVVLARPGRDVRTVLRWLALPAAVAALLWVWAFAALAPEQRFREVGAFSLSQCVGLISLLASGPVLVLLAALRDGASVRPGFSGFVAGLAAGSGATAGYSLFCGQDNPLFFVTWYGFAILLVSGLGALAGARLLRW